MKSKLLDNLGLKILAVIVAIILWLVVMNVSDYAVTNDINGIPVIQLNGEALDELDRIYDVAKGNTVDIIVKGRRSLVEGLTADDFIATADLSTMSITNTVQIFVEPKNKNLVDEITITYVDNVMSLSLENKMTAQFQVAFKTLGTVEENYAVADISSTPNIITVEGPETAVSKITRAEVELNVDGKYECYEQDAELILYDAYDEVINNEKLKISNDSVHVNVEIYRVKEVPIEVKTQGRPIEGWLVSNIMFQPQSVKVVGSPDVLSRVDKITIDDIAIAGLKSNYEATVDINEYLPRGVALVQTTNEAAITVEIERAISKTFSPAMNDFILLNRNFEYVYEVTPSEDFAVTVTGLERDVKDMTIADLKLKIDCSEFYYGMYNNVAYEINKFEDVTIKTEGTVDVEMLTPDEAEARENKEDV